MIVDWFKLQFPNSLLLAIPNQLIRGRGQAIFMTKMGLIKGFPDLLLLEARSSYHALAIELKRPAVITHEGKVSEGKASVNQLDVIRKLNDLGYLALVCWGFEDARRAILSYMNNEM